MHSFPLLLLIFSVAFPPCFCTKTKMLDELLAECEALYDSGEFQQMQENMHDQFDNDPLKALEGIKAAGGLDKFIHPIKNVELKAVATMNKHKFVINKELLDKLKEKIYVPGKTYAEALKNHLNYYIFGKTNFEVLTKAVIECNIQVEMHLLQQLGMDGRVNALMGKRRELLNAIQTEDY